MIPSRRDFLASLAALATPTVASSAAPTLGIADLRADAALAVRAYDTLHPGLRRYNTPDQFAGHVAALHRALDREQTLGEAYLAFSVFAASLRCGHTYANFYNQARATRLALFEGANRLPVHFVWLDRRMIVTRNFSADARLVPGSEIVAIDGVPTSEILRRLMTVARADGANDAKRMAWMQVQGEDPVEAFDVFLPLFYPGIGARQRLDVRTPGATEPRAVEVEALDAARRREARPARTQGEGPLWTLDTTDPGLAILRMPTWALYDTRWDWRAWLHDAFDTLVRRGTPALAVDLRANEGGEDAGDVLLAHLIDRPLRVRAFDRLVRYRQVPDDLAPHLDTWDPSFRNWGDAAEPFDARFLRLRREGDRDGTVIEPAAPHYRGQLFVLVGATNSSATFNFAQSVRDSGVGTLVGQPTGGNLRGINGGAFFFLKLPNSGIELDLPLIGQFPLGPTPPDQGLAPDIVAAPTARSIAAGIDVGLVAVRRLAGAEPPETPRGEALP